jgi:hypothetical protein
MPTCNIIVDSCAYFRLAQSIRPLLKKPFGKEKHCLGVIQELDNEYEKSPSLKHKFYWVNDDEFAANRKRCFALTTAQKSEINHAFFFIREFARDEHIGVSEVDIKALSYAHVLKIPLVTDDDDMLIVAKEFEISTLKTLHLLKLLLDSGVVTMERTRAIAAYWIYQNDTPKSYRKDFRRIFLEDPPR